MNLFGFLAANRAEFIGLVWQHLTLVTISTVLSVLIGIPTGILVTRRPSLSAAVLGAANVLQTIPSLALFGLLIPLPFVGGVGARTAIVALVVYALLPVIRNTVTGIRGLEPSVREAALGMGMTDRELLRLVELPLATPVIMAGIRVAAVVGVGVATIAAAVGAGGLGVYIFRGVATVNDTLILAGALPAAVMALGIDGALGLVEKRLKAEG